MINPNSKFVWSTAEEHDDAWREISYRLPGSLVTVLTASRIGLPAAAGVGFALESGIQLAWAMHDRKTIDLNLLTDIASTSAVDVAHTSLSVLIGGKYTKLLPNQHVIRGILSNLSVGLANTGLDLSLFGTTDFQATDLLIWTASGAVGGKISPHIKQPMANGLFEYFRELLESGTEIYSHNGKITSADALKTTWMASQELGTSGWHAIHHNAPQPSLILRGGENIHHFTYDAAHFTHPAQLARAVAHAVDQIHNPTSEAIARVYFKNAEAVEIGSDFHDEMHTLVKETGISIHVSLGDRPFYYWTEAMQARQDVRWAAAGRFDENQFRRALETFTRTELDTDEYRSRDVFEQLSSEIIAGNPVRAFEMINDTLNDNFIQRLYALRGHLAISLIHSYDDTSLQLAQLVQNLLPAIINRELHPLLRILAIESACHLDGGLSETSDKHPETLLLFMGILSDLTLHPDTTVSTEATRVLDDELGHFLDENGDDGNDLGFEVTSVRRLLSDGTWEEVNPDELAGYLDSPNNNEWNVERFTTLMAHYLEHDTFNDDLFFASEVTTGILTGRTREAFTLMQADFPRPTELHSSFVREVFFPSFDRRLEPDAPYPLAPENRATAISDTLAIARDRSFDPFFRRWAFEIAGHLLADENGEFPEDPPAAFVETVRIMNRSSSPELVTFIDQWIEAVPVLPAADDARDSFQDLSGPALSVPQLQQAYLRENEAARNSYASAISDRIARMRQQDPTGPFAYVHCDRQALDEIAEILSRPIPELTARSDRDREHDFETLMTEEIPFWIAGPFHAVEHEALQLLNIFESPVHFATIVRDQPHLVSRMRQGVAALIVEDTENETVIETNQRLAGILSLIDTSIEVYHAITRQATPSLMAVPLQVDDHLELPTQAWRDFFANRLERTNRSHERFVDDYYSRIVPQLTETAIDLQRSGNPAAAAHWMRVSLLHMEGLCELFETQSRMRFQRIVQEYQDTYSTDLRHMFGQVGVAMNTYAQNLIRSGNTVAGRFYLTQATKYRALSESPATPPVTTGGTGWFQGPAGDA